MTELPNNCDGEDCTKCSGEYCETHNIRPCDCDIVSRHYYKWIEKNIPEKCTNMCEGATIRMVIDFPELKRVRGYYLDALVGERPHWWCVTPNGEIIDPTKAQFSDKNGDYIPYDESQPEPTGKCYNCGGLCYNGRECCSESCHFEYARFCTSSYDPYDI